MVIQRTCRVLHLNNIKFYWHSAVHIIPFSSFYSKVVNHHTKCTYEHKKMPLLVDNKSTFCENKLP